VRTILICAIAFQSAMHPVILQNIRISASKCWRLSNRPAHGIVAIMAAKRHARPALLVLMALVLVLPPLTSVLADGLGIELAHHHCTSLAGDAGDIHANHDAVNAHDHGAAETDPFQCDQCHVALTALAFDTDLMFGADVVGPEGHLALALVPVHGPPTFKPPIV
jgi:hypothetical protein